MFRFVIQIAVIVSVLVTGHENDVEEGGSKWNELVFTQMWGYASCLQFKDETHGQNACTFEGNPSIWSIHGIWPTETGSFGPNFCTKVKFVEQEIKSIEEQLNEYWYEINAEKDGINFWTHEWTKHGSCAMSSPKMDTQLKYFQMGLSLRQQYDLYTLLKDSGIYPKASPQGYSSSDIVRALQNTLKATPHIQCYSTKVNGKEEHHLLAVEVCLDTTFAPADCGHRTQFHMENPGVYGESKACPPNETILYVDVFPKKSEL